MEYESCWLRVSVKGGYGYSLVIGENEQGK